MQEIEKEHLKEMYNNVKHLYQKEREEATQQQFFRRVLML